MRIAFLPERPDSYGQDPIPSPTDRRRLATLIPYWEVRGATAAPYATGLDADIFYFVASHMGLSLIEAAMRSPSRGPGIALGITEDLLTADWAAFDNEKVNDLETIAAWHFGGGRRGFKAVMRRWANRLGLPISFRARMLRAVAGADVVICASEAQAASLRSINPFAVAIAEAIPASDFEPARSAVGDALLAEKAASGATLILWEGTAYGLHLLELLRDPLERLHRDLPGSLELVVAMPRERPAPFHGITDNAEILRSIFAFPTRFVPWTADTIGSVIRACDIGIAPMADRNPFYAAKAHNKPAVYMSLGLPVVVSDILSYRQFVHHGEDGLVAATTDQWYDHLRRLVTDRDFRHRAGLAARATFEATGGVEAVADRFYQAFELGCAVARVRRSVGRRAQMPVL